MDALNLAAVLLLLAFLEYLVYRLFALRAIQYHRGFDRHTATEGQQVRMVEVIRNHKLLPLPWLRVESRIAPQLRFAARDDLEVSGLRYHRSVFFLAPFQQVTRRHAVTASKRGVYQLDSVALTAGDLFGSLQQTATLSVFDELVVYPRPIEDRRILQRMSVQGDQPVRRYLLPDPFWFRGVRAYQPGDAPRDIHWRATARTGEMQVRQFETTQASDLTLVMNTQLFDDQWDNLSEAQREILETGVRMALTIGFDALASGCRVAFLANGTLYKRESTVCLEAGGGSAQRRRLMETLARLQIVRKVSFPNFLREQTALRGQDVLILSYYDSRAIREAMACLRARGNQMALALIPGRREA